MSYTVCCTVCFLTRTLYAVFLSPIHTICPIHPILLVLISTLILVNSMNCEASVYAVFSRLLFFIPIMPKCLSLHLVLQHLYQWLCVSLNVNGHIPVMFVGVFPLPRCRDLGLQMLKIICVMKKINQLILEPMTSKSL